jgi:hypothetical protein
MLDTKPKPPRTNRTNYECYARTLNDCSEEITREHYISKALLERLMDFEGTGMAWNPGPLPLGPNALRSWVLCKRHNNALSPLDENIVQLYDLMRRFQDRKPVGDLVLDGEDIERWSIKVMCGLLASGSVEADASRSIAQQRSPSGTCVSCSATTGCLDSSVSRMHTPCSATSSQQLFARAST